MPARGKAFSEFIIAVGSGADKASSPKAQGLRKILVEELVLRPLCYLILPLLVITYVLVGCNWDRSRAPNVVIVAVDSLSSSEVNCSEDVMVTGGAFSTLCQETVRFTHAYTPSVLAAPALASVLTGKYPLEHGLRHNGSVALPTREQTLPELALRKGYRTAMFSGGPPIFRKSGLDQGFEIFEDNISPTLHKLYRPFAENVNYFERWVRSSGRSPFFAVFYVPDLKFVNTQTVNRLGEARNLSYASQLMELDESLYDLIEFLKSWSHWDNTVFVLLGLNGKTLTLHRDEIDAVNLYSDNSQVALLAKPVRKKRDLGLHWKIDRNVSLVDVGKTLAEAIEVKLPSVDNPDLKAISFLSSLGGEDPAWESERLILTESAWASWRGYAGIRWAARKGHWLYLHNERPLVFNTLLDRMEVAPTSLEDDRTRDLVIDLLSFFSKYQLLSWYPLSEGLKDKLFLARQRWLPAYFETPRLIEDIRLLHKQGYKGKQVLGWWADLAVEQEDWEELKEVARIARVDTWRKLAESHLENKPVSFADPCLSTLDPGVDDAESIRRCEDRLFLQLRDWLVRAPGSSEGERAREIFLRNYRWALIDRKIAELNYAMGGVWDVSLAEPDGPTRIEMALALPKYKRYRRITRLRLGR